MAKALRSTRVLTPQGLAPAIVMVERERISDILSWDDLPPDAILHDFGDRVLLPGLVDSHVHINEPGRTEWEGFETATRAAAAGGVTTLVDMPLNCIPETIDVPALEAKRAAAQWQSVGGLGCVGRRGAGQRRSRCPRWCVPAFPASNAFSFTPESTALRGSMKRICALALEKLRGTGLPLLAHAEVAGPVGCGNAER